MRNEKKHGVAPNLWNERVKRGEIRAQDFTRPWYRYARRLISDLDLGDAVACDIGCGACEFSLILSQGGVKVKCLDGDSDNVERARKIGFRAELVDLEQGLPLTSDSCDLAVMLEVVEHITRAEFLLQEVHRILKQGGYLLLSTPNVGYISHRFRFLLGCPIFLEGQHFRFFTKGLLQAKLTAAGFKIVRRMSFGKVPGVSRVIGLLGCEDRFVKIPAFAEALFSLNFVWLVKRG